MLPVAAEDLLEVVEARVVLLAQRVRRPVKVADVAIAQNVADERAFAVLLEKGVHRRLELGTVLAHGPGNATTLAENDVVAHPDVLEHVFPEFGLVVVHNRPGQQAGVDHLDQVIVFQGTRERLDLYGIQALLRETPVHRLNAFSVA